MKPKTKLRLAKWLAVAMVFCFAAGELARHSKNTVASGAFFLCVFVLFLIFGSLLWKEQT